VAYVEQARSVNLWKVGFDPTSATVEGEPAPLIPGSRQMIGVDVSPAGDWLAFFSPQSSGQEDIYVMTPDGSSLRQLTDDVHYDRWPCFSPDGKTIAFYSNRSGNTDIWTIRPDGSELRQLTKTPGMHLGNAYWSPDGLRLSCYDWLGGGSYIFDPNKPWEEQVPEALPSLGDDGELFVSTTWSRDGRWLAGTKMTDQGLGEAIVLYSLESHQYRELTNNGTFATWLPDSRRLLIGPPLRMLDIESGTEHEILSLSPDIIVYAAVSPDGQTLYFSRRKNEADIWMLTLNEEQK
jgi:Tol biopolymer transport system component